MALHQFNYNFVSAKVFELILYQGFEQYNSKLIILLVFNRCAEKKDRVVVIFICQVVWSMKLYKSTHKKYFRQDTVAYILL